MSRPQLSVIVPVLNEERSIPPLVNAVRDALASGPSWELVFVDDGSTDATRDRIRDACREDPRIHAVELARNYGQSTAMQAGFDHCRGQIVVTMDGDLQNDPADIPALLRKIAEGYDLVVGYRHHRKDDLLRRRLPSWLANRIIVFMTGVPIRDTGCSLKAYRRELLQRMRLYSDMHRFIPPLAVATAGARLAEVPVRHHPRVYGKSKYGLSRVVKVLSDLLLIKLIRSFRSRPLALAGMAAITSLAMGLVFGGLALADRLSDDPAESLVVFIGVSLVLVALGVFLLLLGLIAEAAVLDHDRTTWEPPFLVREVS